MNKRILLADDSLTIQKVVELTFMDESFDVEAVGSGDEALASLDADLPDVVIADVHMPGASGYEVCRRAKEFSSDLPVLLLVGTFEALDEDELVACGADGNLKKPFDSQELLQLVQELAERQPGERSAAETDAEEQTEEQTEETAGETPDEATDVPPVEGFETTEFPVGDAGEGATDAPAGGAGFDLGASVDEPEPTIAAAAEEAPEPADEDAVEAAVDQAVEAEVESAETVEFGFDSGVEQVSPEIDEALDETPEEPVVASTAADPMDALLGALDDAEEKPEPPPAISALDEAAEEPPATAETAEEPETGADETEAAAGPALSEADIDRVARRVVELLGDDTVREVAWEVIPDLAEIVIKDRIRELEAEVD